FDDVCLKLALQSDPDFRWCQSGSECGSGQIHVEGNKSPKMICEKCGKATCYTHNASWHEGITCNEYDIKNGKTDIESQAYLEKNTKPCPKCGIHIQKIDGCDHIKCKIESCLMEFCWL
ncbi:2224_t:CDS:2, partial [Scutellospora calospora]